MGSDDDMVAVCQEYIEIIADLDVPTPLDLMSVETCVDNVADFGVEGILSTIDILKRSAPICISDANDPKFLHPLGPCEQGVELQYRTAGGDWTFLRGFPAELPYCDNTINVLFDRTMDADGNYINYQD